MINHHIIKKKILKLINQILNYNLIKKIIILFKMMNNKLIIHKLFKIINKLMMNNK